MPPLLVQRAIPACERHVVSLLGEVPIDPREVGDLIRRRSVLELGDVTLLQSAPPVAAAAFRFDRPARTAQLAGMPTPPAATCSSNSARHAGRTG